MSLQLERTDVLIIGSGLAAVTVALHLPDTFRVLLVTKGRMTETNSDLAQGGIASAYLEETGAAHVQDTLAASKQTARADRVRLLVEAGRDVVRDMEQYGVSFDRDGDTYALGREGAHGTSRIFHVGGDETGRHVMATLRDRLPNNVHVMEHVLIDRLLQSEGRVMGASGFKGEARIQIQAGAVVLATGGVGGLVDWTSNCRAVTGDGLVLAKQAGAKLSNLTNIQFHPTLLAVETPVLVTEALRGAGATLVDAKGRHVMRHHPLGSLAPRDDVAAVLTAFPGQVYLETSRVERLAERFPKLAASCRAHHLDASSIPVRPGLHFQMGGVAVDAEGRTTVQGLYAVGEVAETGVHGKNRLASNSLLECWVFGKRVAAAVELLDCDSGEKGGTAYEMTDEVFQSFRRQIGKWLTISPAIDEIRSFLENTQQLTRTKHVTRQLAEQTLQLEAARLLAHAFMEREGLDEPIGTARSTDTVFA
ncbi:FAD-binding protein [Exiguobacterium sp.]|uniref:L-aspartate oxidase n=1 Tax=Exiguobacterium sp. TaxID=44751 RepID=UPI00263B1632|nr:FAD-binding protein [Exiguobacterium sp.]MCC5892627.1 FAD-binding protein [Exiguobacterium sp.]